LHFEIIEHIEVIKEQLLEHIEPQDSFKKPYTLHVGMPLEHFLLQTT
jgi:hypothetical protein